MLKIVRQVLELDQSMIAIHVRAAGYQAPDGGEVWFRYQASRAPPLLDERALSRGGKEQQTGHRLVPPPLMSTEGFPGRPLSGCFGSSLHFPHKGGDNTGTEAAGAPACCCVHHTGSDSPTALAVPHRGLRAPAANRTKHGSSGRPPGRGPAALPVSPSAAIPQGPEPQQATSAAY